MSLESSMMPEELPADSGLLASYPVALSYPLTILIVDDEVVFTTLIARQLRALQEAFPQSVIEVVHDWTSAIRAIQAEPPPSVALLDLKMPGPDGSSELDLKQAVAKAMELDERTAVVVITGHRKEDVEALLVGSSIEVLEKGQSLWHPGNIIRAIVRALDRKQCADAQDRFLKVRGIVETLKNLGYGTPETT